MITDWSAAAAWIALIVAIISPVITTVLNNRFQLKLKDRELMVRLKLDVIEGYLKAVSDASYATGVPDDFAKYQGLIFLYAPENTFDKIAKLNRAVEATRFSEETASLLYDVAKSLRAENKVR